MEGVDKSTAPASIALALVQEIAVNQHQCARLDLSQCVFFLLQVPMLLVSFPLHLLLHFIVFPLRRIVMCPLWKPLSVHFHKLSAPAARLPDEPAAYLRPSVRAPCKTQTPILRTSILERDPEPHRTGRVCVKERAVLMWWHPAANLGLLANCHALQYARVPEAQRTRDGCVAAGDGGSAEGSGQLVQVMADFVHGEVLGFCEGTTGRVKGVFFEEKANLISAGEEIVVADVRRRFSRGKSGEGMGVERERVEHAVRFGQEGRSDGG